ncbi:DUF885 domain-containing protein [Faecalicatena contorta]|uniref:DUF885 domain-containing protein n=1 Tax=Faecalicatena contorta TaxID=39482 RepID=UPI001F40C48F|nr:DUF885 domain-containing protein [Faecalicatena contorta]MCF2553941.1 DUF885 domain-containing protein [Faecalicatena contorta]
MSKKRSIFLASIFLVILSFAAFFFHHSGQNENQKFEEYTEKLFCQEVSSSTITLHYTLKDPEAFQIEEGPAKYGQVSCDTASMCASAENALAVLHSYDRRHLSEENKLIYDILENTFSLSMKTAKYALYEEPLAPLTGTQSQLPVLLSEFPFYDTEDVDIYLELLSRTPDYFYDICTFEKARSDAGLFMASYTVDAIIEECQAFIEMGAENYLYSSFESRIKELHLSENEQKQYIAANQEQLENHVFPAYEGLISTLQELRTTGKNQRGLCYLPDGKQYYELLVASETGSSREIPALQELTQAQMQEDFAAIQQILAEDSNSTGSALSAFSDIFQPQGTLLTDNAPAAILKELENCLDGEFPAPPAVDTRIKYVQKSMEEYLSPAFYMIPAMDNTSDNVIYINEGHMPDDLSLFTTLAHEGYPGHLYQTIYFASTDPAPIRSLLSCGGYIEGWATYSEMLSYYYAPISKELAGLMQHNASIILGLYALTDMGIHYDGWNLLDTVAFFQGYGITDTATIEDIYDLIIADPGNYLKYYIGYVEFLELKKDAIEAWGDDFTQKRFHKAVLDIGPAPFEILRNQLGTGFFSKNPVPN